MAVNLIPRLRYALWAACVCISACKKNTDALAVSRPGTNPPQLIFTDRHYGDDPNQRMDIYLPMGRTKKATHIMVFIHGGGWLGGDKIDYTPASQAIVNQGNSWAVLNLNYRLTTDSSFTFPAQEEDIEAALNYVWSRADSFNISTSTGLIGVSAGGHLASLTAYKHNDNGYIKALVTIFGVYDMKRFYDEGSAGVPELANEVLGGTPNSRSTLYASSSPLFYVNKQSVPTLMMHGTLDTLVRYDQAIALDSVLKKYKVTHEFYTFTGYHAIPAANATEAADKMFAYIARYVK
jgi:acetyl esterase/lipase